MNNNAIFDGAASDGWFHFRTAPLAAEEPGMPSYSVAWEVEKSDDAWAVTRFEIDTDEDGGWLDRGEDTGQWTFPTLEEALHFVYTDNKTRS